MQTASYQPAGKATEKANCRAVSDIFFTMFLQNRLERGPKALGVENFHAAITFETQTTSISRRISQNPSRTMQIASDNRIVQRNAVQVLRATKMMTFHFREVYFTSYVDSDVSKCYFPRQSPSDLPLRSCLYDASISSYRQSKFRTLLRSLRRYPILMGIPSAGALNTQWLEKLAIFDGNRRLSRKWCEIGRWLLWNINRKSCVPD